MIMLADIRRAFRGSIRLNEPLAGYTAFGVGGSSDFFFEPVSPADTVELLRSLAEHQVPLVLVARGCNLLVSDEGFRGAAVSLERACGGIVLQAGAGTERLVTAGAGARLARLVDFCVQHGVAGLERFAGLAGTVGGACLDDTGDGASFRALADEITFARAGRAITAGPSGAALRTALEAPARDVILSVRLRLTAASTAGLLRLRREVLVRRVAAQGMNVPAAGAAFRDLPGRRAVELLREAGCAGMRCGAAVADLSWPNAIVNTGKARAADVMALLKAMQGAVRSRCQVELPLLARPVGFTGQSVREVA